MTISLETVLTMKILAVMDWQEAGLRCVLEGGMALCVMTFGTTRMPQWCASNLGSLPTVSVLCNQVNVLDLKYASRCYWAD